MKLQKLLFTLTLPLIFGTNSIFACTCYAPPPPCYNYSKFDVVFVGTVTKVNSEGDENQFEPKVEINVEKNYKGINSDLAITRNWASSCAWEFSEGEKFLFYGNKTKTGENHFTTGFCTRTSIYDEKLADFDFFEAVNSGSLNYWIWGTVRGVYLGSPAIEGVRAEVQDGGKVLSGVSDNNGDIKIVVSKEGRYKARVFPPKGADVKISQWEEQHSVIKRGGIDRKKRGYIEYEVEVKNNKCGWFDAIIEKPKD